MALPSVPANSSVSEHEKLSKDGPDKQQFEGTHSLVPDSREMQSVELAFGVTAEPVGPQSPHFETSTRIPMQLPVEIWERIIDHLELYCPDMWPYGSVCWAWYHRTRFYALQRVSLYNKKAVYSLVKMMERRENFRSAVKHVSIHDKIDVLGTFSICLAEKLPNVEVLRIFKCEWSPGWLHPHIFMHVSATFQTVTTLLYDIAFPTTAVFGRLICSLPQLSSLNCMNVRFKKPGFTPGFVRSVGRPSLTSLDLLNGGSIGSHEYAAIEDILAFAISTSIVSRLRHIGLYGRESLDIVPSQQLLDFAGASLTSVSIFSKLSSTDPSSPNFLTFDFSAAINLETLTLHLEIHSLILTAISLARALPPKLREVKIVHFRVKTEDVLIDQLSDNDHIAVLIRIDRLLSGPQYKRLDRVIVQLCVARSAKNIEEVPSERIWREVVSSRLPKLRDSGILR
ncbi:uncharacterized protein FIBRA_08329 [Fibroporia radiculosa]|uniref:F-box domain-containing protein n=1 Tax=Fibroporia radiculosa TaxID=599839 RepID=J4I2J9_9APHY|nr:uncharacterized protein FIBRA_08329 [Fibroporia radiculosa]CCM06082.1 predicted protein [Fibroporia radiculosa]